MLKYYLYRITEKLKYINAFIDGHGIKGFLTLYGILNIEYSFGHYRNCVVKQCRTE